MMYSWIVYAFLSSFERFSKSLRVADKHIALAAAGAVELHDHRTIDFGSGLELARHRDVGPGEPLALQLTAGFPIQHGLVAEIRNRHLLVLVQRQIRDERSVRHDDDFPALQLAD